jgi:hypothetical protein
MKAYIVGRGEDLHSIAARFGFDALEVWNASDNQELRELRGDPQVLAPGDVLYVPEVEDEDLPLTARTTNTFIGEIERVNVNLDLSAGSSSPLANEPYEIHGLREVVTGTSDDQGRIQIEVPAHVRTLTVYFPEQQSSARVRLGGLNPIDHDSGIRTRLFNLGYLASNDLLGPALSPTRSPAARRAELARAVRDFQEDAGLEATGELDEATRAAIADRHGQ